MLLYEKQFVTLIPFLPLILLLITNIVFITRVKTKSTTKSKEDHQRYQA